MADPFHVVNGALPVNNQIFPDSQQYAGTPPPVQHARDPAVHQRTYQACIPCRKRKVRCDLGSVDNPNKPPCMRCRRESKDCYFSSTRRKKKGANGEDAGFASDDDSLVEVKTSRKRARASTVEEDEDSMERPRTPGGSVGRTQPLRRPEQKRPVKHTEEDEQAAEQSAAMLQATEIHSGHDALKVLYEAAKIRERLNSREALERPNFSGTSPLNMTAAISPVMERIGTGSYNHGGMSIIQDDPVWRTNGGSQSHVRSSFDGTSNDSTSYVTAVNAWSRFRFVREGWFTAKEAIDYIQYFYKYLAPLTPVALPDFRPFETHQRLLEKEPMLTITMLLIASRHAKLEGPGSVSRPYEIHKRLWSYLQGMINRVVWGQEQFGGGFCGAGSEPASDVNPLSRRGLRTLGTVESLVLLTEWHPRMMHFPPDEADSELMMPVEPVKRANREMIDEQQGLTAHRMDAWLEPVWRSDRMCWMLLGMAMSLAMEIGVFDITDWNRHNKYQLGAILSPSAEDLETYNKRRGSVRDLLLVYVTQTSGRLGLTTMLPSDYSKPEDSELFKRGVGQHGNMQETVMHFWLRMAAIIREGNQQIFANKAFTRDLIKNGDYKTAIERMQEPLAAWLQEFRACTSMPKYMRAILMIEYNYCKVYLNALALQAVAERCANEQPVQNLFETPVEAAKSAISTNGIRIDSAIQPQTLAKWLGGDRKYMLAVGDAARNLLKVVVDDLYPQEYLRHAPVRTYFRVISTAMMLLKSFSLGASESDIVESLQLLDRTVTALKTCIVDDVHVASRFAELLQTLSDNLKPRLVRISADGRAPRSGRISQRDTPAPTLGPSELGMRSRAPFASTTSAQAVAGAMQTQQQRQQQLWNLNGSFDNTLPAATSSNFGNTVNGISDNLHDLGESDMIVMPPPNYLSSPIKSNIPYMGAYDPVHGTNTFGMPNNHSSNSPQEDWLALPLNNLYGYGGNDHHAVVRQTMGGPVIDGHDMLEVLFADGNGFDGGQNGYNELSGQYRGSDEFGGN
ncbi:hypothetical protein BAUCODRAFT_31811 [Baudoinia panamericana UAMH 10762]|uniref:Zn(2)-C6 fungal-type domain-containing protein n=1 Tax=Baudoinia panamericana (strain UAMH 10762) TaxID=717646 RepID=M2MM90_BAUPA|nr:uncharacterized protein BAUCODRAFT_31811 [Baudoinia panamericana UAMH 10762]EMC97806.1 hypothetical protein BAUCODRAFT_31811 [Baudoinia panamericana UAMH 10762]